MVLEHLGESGLRLSLGGASLCFDPPGPVEGPVVLTWSEQERVMGARVSRGALAAHPDNLRFMGREGLGLVPGPPVTLGAFTLRAFDYTPIPYAVPAEAVRKTLSALRSPGLAYRRLRHTLRRPGDPPLVVEVTLGSTRVVHLGQSLHRFADPSALARELEGADLAIAGPDFEDELATGRLLHAFRARHNVIADLVGTVRRRLGLPVRPLALSLREAPTGTRVLHPGDRLDLGPA
ncbi:MAG: hypothetical protein FJ102_04970 [Deltaproteobacteria bacterium]|nr:hypothetical protein [Deltaproteobacteria bacterium]